MHAPVLVSLIVAIVVGFLAQRTRFCTMGSLRDVALIGDMHLISGVGGLVLGAFILNVLLGQFHPGFAKMPVSHSAHLWNFSGMMLAGLAFALAGGCPGRQLFLSGEGDGDAAVFVLGMIVGAGFSHNFFLAGVPDTLDAAGNLVVGGPGPFGKLAVVIGLLFCVILGFVLRPARAKY